MKSKCSSLAFKSLLWPYLSVPTVFPAKLLQTLPILGLCPGKAFCQPHSAATHQTFGGLAKCPLLPLTLSPIHDMPLQKPNQTNQSRKLLFGMPRAFHLLFLPYGSTSTFHAGVTCDLYWPHVSMHCLSEPSLLTLEGLALPGLANAYREQRTILSVHLSHQTHQSRAHIPNHVLYQTLLLWATISQG